VPDIARIVCAEHAVRVLTPEVRPQVDGVHIAVDNRSSAVALDLHHTEWERGDGVGGDVGRRSGERGYSIEPGELLIACERPNSSYVDSPPATLTIVDPAGLWIPTEPTCAEPRRFRIAGREPLTPDVARRVLDGLLPSDEIVQPGYPQTPWMLPLLVVRRDGVVIASLTPLRDLNVEVCPDSGITPAPKS
jgi:hypothetical protein